MRPAGRITTRHLAFGWRVAFWLLAWLLPAPAQTPPAVPAGTPPQTPFLRIEAGGHSGAVPHLAVDASGRLLASAGYDKTIRLWSLPDGKQRAVLRPPIGTLQEGEIYAVAITPDGKRVFAAGATGGSWDGTFSVYLFDARRATLIGRLPGLPSPVFDLAVSPDGTRFAAGLAHGGIRVWDANTGKPVFEDAAYGGPVRTVAFDGQNRLFASCADGRVRAYDATGRKTSEVQPQPGLHPWGLAVSPDGSLLAITYDTPDKQGRLHVDVVSARNLAPAFAPDMTGLSGEGLLAVSWAATGNGGVKLLAAGYAHGAGGNVIRRWDDFGLGPATDLPAARDTILDLKAIPGGGAVYSAEDPGWGRIGTDGTVAVRPAPPIADLRPAREQRLAVSADGSVVEFATATGLQRFTATSGGGLAAITSPDTSLAVARTAAPGIAVVNWKDSNAAKLNNLPLALDHAEYSRSLAILPDGSGLLLGTDTNLRLFGRDGREIAAVPVPAAAWAVTVSADGHVAVAALLDGTLRWYGIGGEAKLEERVALFAHADGARWVLFTPEGFFDHADRGGKDLVGVLLNRGHDQQPDWVSFAQAYRPLYAPAVVRARLAGDIGPARTRVAENGDLRARFARQPSAEIAQLCAVLPDASCQELDPRSVSQVPAQARSLRMLVKMTDRGLGIGNIDAFVNDRNVGRSAPPAEQNGNASATINVPLDPGEDTVRLRVYDKSNTVYAETAELDVDSQGGNPGDAAGQHGRLFLLAIGIDKFASPSLTLNFGVADATTFADTVKRAATPLFSTVDVTLLTNQQATRSAILAAFDRLAHEVRGNDTFLFYVATHGVRDDDGRFVLVPQDVKDLSSIAALTRASLDETTLVDALSRIRARDALLFLDTCHAGAVTADALANVGHETGRYLLAASSSVQEALDSYDNRNGVFVYAVREAMQGRAPHGADDIVSALALGEYVSGRVGQLARQKGQDQDAVFKTAQEELHSFPIGTVIGLQQ